MSPERPQPDNVYGFTDKEMLWDRISHAHFIEILQDKQTTIHEIELSSNDYGEFLFVSTSRQGNEKAVHITFWGLGYHEYRERWMSDVWFWYEGTALREGQQPLPLDDAQKLIEERQAEIAPSVASNTRQSERAALFEMLADLTDEDGALAEIEDMGEWSLEEFEPQSLMQQQNPALGTLPEAEHEQILMEGAEHLQSEPVQEGGAELQYPQMIAYPTNTISKEDLIYLRPEFGAQIEALSDEDMRKIADRVGEIIKDEYWSAIDQVLRRSFGEQSQHNDDD